MQWTQLSNTAVWQYKNQLRDVIVKCDGIVMCDVIVICDVIMKCDVIVMVRTIILYFLKQNKQLCCRLQFIYSGSPR